MTRELESIVQQRPVLWVGAGLSVAGGFPAMDAIMTAVRAAAPRDLPAAEFTALVDAFVDAASAGALGDLLQRHLQRSHGPTLTHRTIARLARAGCFAALVTTNPDDLLEQALAAEDLEVVVQTLDRTATVGEQDGALRLLKVHGSFTDWQAALLSGRAAADFDARHDFLRAELDVLLQQHPLIFVGCSLQDPRMLQWIESRPDPWMRQLKPWRAVMRPSAWAAALERPWKRGEARSVLMRAPLEPIETGRHEDLPAMWLEVARRLAPRELSDLELLAGWRGGDRNMGSVLYKRYAEPIAGFFRRNLRNRAEVEDLTQETFIALRGSTSVIENVSGFLFRIAFFKFTHYLRRIKGLPEVADGHDDLEHIAGELTPDPEFVQSQREDTRLLLRSIRRLSLIHQQVLELSFWEGKSGPEIAAILDVPIGTVASRLRHAKSKLDEKRTELADSLEALRATTMTVAQWQQNILADLNHPVADPAPPRPTRKM
jgi:RNA polymerase sigma factor (sigma-70 family)